MDGDLTDAGAVEDTEEVDRIEAAEETEGRGLTCCVGLGAPRSQSSLRVW